MEKIRTNLVLDRDKLQALKILAATEDVTVSELVTEGIDRVIELRIQRGGADRQSAQERLNSLFERVKHSLGAFDENEIEADISAATKR